MRMRREEEWIMLVQGGRLWILNLPSFAVMQDYNCSVMTGEFMTVEN
jgi:hypothetical protein